jgi:hypothetical protein
MRDVPAYISFKINQNYIAKNLCINRDTPKSTCNGKCHLSYTIVENHDNDGDEALPIFPENTRNLIFTFSNPKRTFIKRNFILKETFTSNQSLIANKYITDIFHPPRLA